MPSPTLTGLILTSPDPDRAAAFYRDVLGLPYALNRHGDLPAHYECDVDGVHYAILRGPASPAGSLVASFAVDDLDAFLDALAARGVPRKHPVLALGGGPRICTVADPDGNDVRLYAAH